MRRLEPGVGPTKLRVLSAEELEQYLRDARAWLELPAPPEVGTIPTDPETGFVDGMAMTDVQMDFMRRVADVHDSIDEAASLLWRLGFVKRTLQSINDSED